jgi:hypothetical protein
MGREPAKEPERAASLAFETRAGAIAPAAEEATANMATASTGGAWRASKCARPLREAGTEEKLGTHLEEHVVATWHFFFATPFLHQWFSSGLDPEARFGTGGLKSPTKA